MKVIILLFLFLNLGCREVHYHTHNNVSTENQESASQVEPTESLEKNEVNSLIIQKNLMFEEPQFSAHIVLPEVPEGYIFSGISKPESGEASYVKNQKEVYFRLINHDDLPKQADLKDKIHVFYLNESSEVFRLELDLTFSIMDHKHEPPVGGIQEIDREYHWMHKNNESIELDIDEISKDTNTTINYTFYAKLAGITGLDYSKTVVKDEAIFKDCEVVPRTIEETTHNWVKCSGSYVWNSQMGNSPMEYIIVEDEKEEPKKLLIMIHFNDPAYSE